MNLFSYWLAFDREMEIRRQIDLKHKQQPGSMRPVRAAGQAIIRSISGRIRFRWPQLPRG